MKRIITLMVAALLWAGHAAPGATQTPTPAAPNAGQAPAGEAQGAGDAGQRGSGFATVVAFVGAALLLLVVCYPSRRY